MPPYAVDDAAGGSDAGGCGSTNLSLSAFPTCARRKRSRPGERWTLERVVQITEEYLRRTESVTLAAILTAILLPWALVKARRSAPLAVMALAMLGRLWRGEAWKRAYLQLEQQAPQQSQLRRPTMSKTVSFDQCQSFLNVDLCLLHHALDPIAFGDGDPFLRAEVRSGLSLRADEIFVH